MNDLERKPLTREIPGRSLADLGDPWLKIHKCPQIPGQIPADPWQIPALTREIPADPWQIPTPTHSDPCPTGPLGPGGSGIHGSGSNEQDQKQERKMINPRVLLTGSRKWDDPDAVAGALRAVADPLIEQRRGPVVLVHGGCRTGVDAMGHEIWSHWHELHPDWFAEPECHPAQWGKHRKAAGPIRNAHMVSLGADVCVALVRNGSAGTLGCIDLAAEAGIPLRVIRRETTA